MTIEDFVFDEFGTRFTYIHTSHQIGLPNNIKQKISYVPKNGRYKNIFHWIKVQINHEFLHKILHEFIGFSAMHKLDYLPYGDMAWGFFPD